jgi:predicted esterase
MRRAVVALVAVLVVGLTGVAPARADGVRYLDPIFDDVEVTTDVAYGAAVNSRGEKQILELDIYEPAGDTATDRPLYVWIHGGTFRSGSRSNSNTSRELAKRGWVVVSISYRLRPELPGNAIFGVLQNPGEISNIQAAALDAQHDAQAAVRWARANATDLGIDPTKIAAGGISAGAITALAVAFNEASPGDSGTPGQPSGIQAAVSHAGAYVPGLQGPAPSPGAPPIALYHGLLDEQVPFPTAPPACVLTILVGNTCELTTFAAGTHATLGLDLAIDFLYRHVVQDDSARNPLPIVTELTDEDGTAFAGVEPNGLDLGAGAGLSAPTDPNEFVAGIMNLVQYAFDSLGIPF